MAAATSFTTGRRRLIRGARRKRLVRVRDIYVRDLRFDTIKPKTRNFR